jgi:hypothetical protein
MRKLWILLGVGAITLAGLATSVPAASAKQPPGKPPVSGPCKGKTCTPPGQTPPVVTVPANITTAATSASGAVVTYTATANDAQDGPLPPTCSPSSGSTFPVGTTTVTCTATDSGGLTGTATFTVTVTPYVPPNTAPVLTFPDPTQGAGWGANGYLSVEANDGHGGWAHTDADLHVTASDAQDGTLQVSCVPVSTWTGDPYWVYGVTLAQCSVTDSGGLSAQGTLAVEVVDHTPPVLTMPSDMTVTATGPSGVAVDYTATANDAGFGNLGDNHNEPWGPVHCDPQSGSVFPVGTTTVSCHGTTRQGLLRVGALP